MVMVVLTFVVVAVVTFVVMVVVTNLTCGEVADGAQELWGKSSCSWCQDV